MGGSEQPGEVVDLFSGPRGWDVGAGALGLDVLGVELDDAAVATSEAAGFRTLKADVSALDPLEFAPVWGLIASPPCQAFSMAGGGAGRRALSAYEEAIERSLEGKPPSREELDEACEDERGHLVLEPLRWALSLRPTWIACEQVEPVLPLWEAMAAGLARTGYSTWTGVLSSEQYGVPQTRRRAILLARRDGIEARRPPATHQRYVAPRRRRAQEEALFEAPEPVRIVAAGEEGLLPWVSMADALGWGGQDGAHYKSSTKGGTRDGLVRPAGAPSRTIDSTAGQTFRVPWCPDDEIGFPRMNDVEGDDGEYRERDLRPATEPAFALTEKARSWTRFRSNSREHATERSVDEPAPTITGGHDHEERRWLRAGTGEHEATRAGDEPAPTLRFGARLNTVAWVTKRGPDDDGVAACGCRGDWVDAGGFCACCSAHLDDPDGFYAIQGDGSHSFYNCPAVVPVAYNSRDQRGRDGAPVRQRAIGEPAPTHLDTGASERAGNQPRAVEDPAPTITASVDQVPARWVGERPATTVNGDPRISEPGHHDSDVSGSQQANAVRVTIEEAAVLQSFPAGYPWQGTRSKVFEQIGNAVPPLMAAAILRSVTA